MSTGNKKCLICNSNVPKGYLINHISEHLNYKRHKCSRCNFKTNLIETMVDHQNQTGHLVEIDAHKNWYMERICQLIYCDIDYAEKNGEDSIRKMGPVFAGRNRLLEMLQQTDHELPVKEEEEILILEADEDEADEEMDTSKTQQINQKVMPSSQRKDAQLDPNPSSSRYIHQQPQIQSVSAKQQSKVQSAPADSSSTDSSKYITGRLLADLHRQITNGLEKRKCRMCTQEISNDYASKKRHVFEKHLENISYDQRLIRSVAMLEKCFKQEGILFITNDAQCNVCGREVSDRASRLSHISSTHTNYQWNCIFVGCNVTFDNFKKFGVHMNRVHGKYSYDLLGEEKDKYESFKLDFQQKITPLFRKCFPFDINNGKAADEDAMIDEITCNFMPTREIPQRLAPRNSYQQDWEEEQFASDASDPSTIKDDDKKPPEINNTSPQKKAFIAKQPNIGRGERDQYGNGDETISKMPNPQYSNRCMNNTPILHTIKRGRINNYRGRANPRGRATHRQVRQFYNRR